MTTDRLLPTEYLARALHQGHDMWQLELHDADGLATFAKDRGLRLVNWGKNVRCLWQIGLLRADIVISDEPIETEGITHLGAGRQGEWHADHRAPILTERGVLNSGKNLSTDNIGKIRPYFHPFRVFVLHHLQRLVSVGNYIAPMQPVWNAEAYTELASEILESVERSSLGDSFAALVDRWHEVAELAILAEPVSAHRIFGGLRMPIGMSRQEQTSRIAHHGQRIAELFTSIGQRAIENARQDICFEAHIVEPNKDLQNLVRLALRGTGLDLHGEIGLAMCFRTMAEAVRRVAETAFSTELPEEDECGAGWAAGLRSYKKTTYGTERIFDSDSAAKAFLRDHGFDRGVKVRWYVEGDTEYGFIDQVLELHGRSGVEVYNLRGQVAQGSKNILSFRESLKNDIQQEIFSLVTVDSDRGEVPRAVRRAIEQGDFFGRFFMPAIGGDFEFANFTADELAEVLVRVAKGNGIDQGTCDRIRAEASGAHDGTDLFTLAKTAAPEFRFGKGQAWGRALATYFLEKPLHPENTDRSIGEAIVYAYRIQGNLYGWTRNKYRVDPNSGKMVEH